VGPEILSYTAVHNLAFIVAMVIGS